MSHEVLASDVSKSKGWAESAVLGLSLNDGKATEDCCSHGRLWFLNKGIITARSLPLVVSRVVTSIVGGVVV